MIVTIRVQDKDGKNCGNPQIADLWYARYQAIRDIK